VRRGDPDERPHAPIHAKPPGSCGWSSHPRELLDLETSDRQDRQLIGEWSTSVSRHSESLPASIEATTCRGVVRSGSRVLRPIADRHLYRGKSSSLRRGCRMVGSTPEPTVLYPPVPLGRRPSPLVGESHRALHPGHLMAAVPAVARRRPDSDHRWRLVRRDQAWPTTIRRDWASGTSAPGRNATTVKRARRSHSAGLVGQLRADPAYDPHVMYSVELSIGTLQARRARGGLEPSAAESS
jgi:hypothetical protein